MVTSAPRFLDLVVIERPTEEGDRWLARVDGKEFPIAFFDAIKVGYIYLGEYTVKKELPEAVFTDVE